MPIEPPTEKAQRILRVLFEAIRAGKIRENDPATFPSYAEVLDGMQIPRNWTHAGVRLKNEGLEDLGHWTQFNKELPKVDGLIINQNTLQPGQGFWRIHKMEGKENRVQWWLDQANQAIKYNWSQILSSRIAFQVAPLTRLREDPKGKTPAYRNIITIEPGKRGGKPCIRGMRITVGDILGWLTAGMSENQILDDFPELTRADIHAALEFAADRENHTVTSTARR